MKYIQILLLIIICLPRAACAQYVSFTKENNGTNTISIPNGEVWQLSSYSAHNPYSSVPLYIYSSTNTASWIGTLPTTGGQLVSQDAASANISTSVGAILVGPALINLSTNIVNYFFVFKKINNSSQNLVSTTSVVIPSSSSGDVDVKLEQSADNVTWTECLPGTYNSSTVKRFFRLRAVEK